MQQKSRAIIAFLCVGLLMGISTQYPDPFHVPEWLEWILVLAYGFTVFWWYHADRTDGKLKHSTWLSIAMVGLPMVGLPYYLFKSRGLRAGLLSLAGAIGLTAIAVALSAGGAMAVVWIRMQLE